MTPSVSSWWLTKLSTYAAVSLVTITHRLHTGLHTKPKLLRKTSASLLADHCQYNRSGSAPLTLGAVSRSKRPVPIARAVFSTGEESPETCPAPGQEQKNGE